MIAFKASAPIISREGSEVGFELLGFDFMIDEDLNVYLIEVNENPCLATLCERQGVLIKSLLADTLQLTVDPIFHLKPSTIDERFCKEDAGNRFTLVHVQVDS